MMRQVFEIFGIFVVLTIVLRYPPALDKNYWGFTRPRVKPAWERLGVDAHGQIYLKAKP
jgi:hypothetical protein